MAFERFIHVEGLNLERFVRYAGNQGIRLREIDRSGPRCIRAIASDADIEKLWKIAADGGWRMKEGSRVGVGRMADRVRGRWLLLAVLAALALMTVVAGRFVWDIRIYDAGAYEADVRQALRDMGISAPMLRNTVDLGALRDELEWRYPQAAWVECGLRGMRLEIRLVEGVVGEMEVTGSGPCDVVAARTGIVQRIVTRAGTPVVKPGDLVMEGDVLIRGEERTSGGEVKPVAARGSVYARVWDSAAVRTSLRVVESIPTGKTQSVQRILSPWFDLWSVEASGYENEDVEAKEMAIGGFFWPLIWRTENRIETDIRSGITDYRSVMEQNNHAATRKLYEMVGGKESLVDNWVNWSIIEDEILLSVATGERLMDIARQERFSGMAATE